MVPTWSDSFSKAHVGRGSRGVSQSRIRRSCTTPYLWFGCGLNRRIESQLKVTVTTPVRCTKRALDEAPCPQRDIPRTTCWPLASLPSIHSNTGSTGVLLASVSSTTNTPCHQDSFEFRYCLKIVRPNNSCWFKPNGDCWMLSWAIAYI